ncbi:unnamed protein product [Rhizophagus irregularis]|nr:unnamed protein product [Rhizophagus irregularis]
MGIEQTLGLENENNDKSKWNNENYEALKLTLNQFIPLIRSIGFSSLGDDYIVDDYGFLFYNSSDNFIFSFENNDDTQNMKLSRVVNVSQAIMVHDSSGFNFSRGSLCMNGNTLVEVR